jgi:NAD(P)H dehydrogenase (quinone)
MQDVNVLITFYSHTGWTEKLALAAALGAVQGRANIRLRRIDAAVDEKTVESLPGWKENRDRMDQEYAVPREADAEWADALVTGTPAELEEPPKELRKYFDLLELLRSRGKLDGKIGAAFTAGSLERKERGALASLCSALAQLGLIVVPLGEASPRSVSSEAGALQSVRLQGRRVAEIARALKQAHLNR